MAGVRSNREKNGKYKGFYIDGQGIQRHFVGTKSKTETRDLADELEAKHRPVRLGIKPAVQDQRPFAEVRDEYLQWGRLKGGRKGHPWGKTHSRMRESYLKFWEHELSLIKIADLNASLARVEKVLSSLSQKGLSGKTLSHFSDGISSFCDFCFKRDYLETDPLRQLGRFDITPLSKRRALTREEIALLLSTCAPQRRLVYLAAIYSGLRANELRNLKVGDLDPVKCGIKLSAHWTKNRKEGFQPLPIDILKNLQSSVSGKSPLDSLLYVPSHTARDLDKDLARCGIPKTTADGKVDFHAFRVAFDTLIFESGATVKEAQELMRHSDPKLTLMTYGRARDERLHSIVASVGKSLSGSLPENAASMRRGKATTPPVAVSAEPASAQTQSDIGGGGGNRTSNPGHFGPVIIPISSAANHVHNHRKSNAVKSVHILGAVSAVQQSGTTFEHSETNNLHNQNAAQMPAGPVVVADMPPPALPPLQNGNQDHDGPVTMAHLCRIRKLLDLIRPDVFRQVLMAFGHNESYTRVCWPSFDGNRIGYIVSRQPISQGEALLARALELEAQRR